MKILSPPGRSTPFSLMMMPVSVTRRLPSGAATIYPGKSAELVLTFEPPTGPPDDYRLELPAQAFGGTDPVKFQIPQAMLRGTRPQP